VLSLVLNCVFLRELPPLLNFLITNCANAALANFHKHYESFLSHQSIENYKGVPKEFLGGNFQVSKAEE